MSYIKSIQLEEFPSSRNWFLWFVVQLSLANKLNQICINIAQTWSWIIAARTKALARDLNRKSRGSHPRKLLPSSVGRERIVLFSFNSASNRAFFCCSVKVSHLWFVEHLRLSLHSIYGELRSQASTNWTVCERESEGRAGVVLYGRRTIRTNFKMINNLICWRISIAHIDEVDFCTIVSFICCCESKKLVA